MEYGKLPDCWKRIFELEWRSVCEGSKAIAAVITDTDGTIISEGRNMTGERTIPNPSAAHAETEAVRGLDTEKFPDKHSYTLHAGLEPCVMCMGTLVMGGIRNVEIAARDDFGGAMHLLGKSTFTKSKNIRVTWLDNELGDVQRALQTIRELLYNTDSAKLSRMLTDFAVYNAAGVKAAQDMVGRGMFTDKTPSDYTSEEVVSEVLRLIKTEEDNL
ncbi:MAG: nucleoside deaminase [Ruminococcus sp.]|nr:nucleoside deaminase [Ruminococcus sp.]